MGYSETLEAAGAKIISFEEFGSYEGDWAALVEYKGETGFVFGSYGSCSGCDAFLAEFDFDDNKPCEHNGKYYRGEYYYEREITKDEYDELLVAYKKRFADFGSDYLTPPLATKEMIETYLVNLVKDDWFSEEKKEMYEWCLSELKKQLKPEQ